MNKIRTKNFLIPRKTGLRLSIYNTWEIKTLEQRQFNNS